MSEEKEIFDRLTKDLKASSKLLGRKQARYLVDLYYTVQGKRLRAESQIRNNEEEPHALLEWVLRTFNNLEKDIKNALNIFTDEYTVGRWLKSIYGIGPVISAGLLVHFDIAVANYVGCFWRFAGLDPTVRWEKGEKRPWNARLKVLCAYKTGESFVKVKSREGDFYGKLYEKRKIYETEKNLRKDYKGWADFTIHGVCPRIVIESHDETCFLCRGKGKVTPKNIGKDTEAYKYYSQGMLPPAHIHSRCRRWTVKLFLAHLHEIMWRDYYGTEPPMPYIFEHQEHGLQGVHKHRLFPPNWPMPEDEHRKSLKQLV